jgi:hypothetical protein
MHYIRMSGELLLSLFSYEAVEKSFSKSFSPFRVLIEVDLKKIPNITAN